MSQLFRDDESCRYFFDIIKATKQQNYINDLVKMSKEAESSKAFGYVLYDSNAFPQLSNLSREFFATNYQSILEAMAGAGVFNSYILLVKQVMGESTRVFHEILNPAHLIIKITKSETEVKKLTTNDKRQIATNKLLGIFATIPITDYTVIQLKKTIDVLCQPAGIFVELRTIYPTEIDITPENASINTGDTVQYSATVTYDDGTSDSNVLWNSSDINIATISGGGLALGKRNGLVDIIASVVGIESFKRSVPLRVNGLSIGASYASVVVKSRKKFIIKDKV
ncbi:Ig-like domain-containing protein [Vibrio harveyi]|uniref:Ig-like domain-containing protein n=1 Tax=Vibrio harveyi TaxID=669 RepID=UPI003CE95324